MQIESKKSVMALVKNVSETGASSITMKKSEYDLKNYGTRTSI